MSGRWSFLGSGIFTAILFLNCVIYFGAKLLWGVPLELGDTLILGFGILLGSLSFYMFKCYRDLGKK